MLNTILGMAISAALAWMLLSTLPVLFAFVAWLFLMMGIGPAVRGWK